MCGHLEVLRWARQHGCPWGFGTCEAAAMGGHLEVLKWARERGCPWGRGTRQAAARGGHLEVLQWAREHGCPESVERQRQQFPHGHQMAIVWLAARSPLGWPWPLVRGLAIAHTGFRVMRFARRTFLRRTRRAPED